MNTSTQSQQYISVSSSLVTIRGIFQVVLSYYDNTNKRKQKWKSLGIKDMPGNKNLAKKQQKELERQFEEELNTPKADNITDAILTGKKTDILYGDYLLKEWLPSIKSSIEITTYSNYENKVKIIAKYFNDLNIKLVDLTKANIKDFYKYIKNTRKVKNQTIKRYHANIHKSLEDAIELELIETNPASTIKLQKAEQFIPSYYTQAELETLFEVAHKTHSFIELHILIMAYYRV